MIINGKTIADYVDINFVLALATIGDVRLCMAQVTVSSDDGLNFKDIKFPSNCVPEWANAIPTAYSGKHIVSITFKFIDPKVI